MKIFNVLTLVLTIGLTACGSEDHTQPEDPTNESSQVATEEEEETTEIDFSSAREPDEPGYGSAPDSCGSPVQELVPIDCTAHGDTGAQCVFSNHCYCTENFQCETTEEGFGNECGPGIPCVPIQES